MKLATIGSRLLAIAKATVAPVTSIFGSDTAAMTRPIRNGWLGGMLESFAGAWQRGVQTDSMGQLTAYGAVYACISRISNDIAKLPPLLMELAENGTWQPADDAKPHWKTLRRPNGFQNRIQFIAYWMACKLMHGNAYALKIRDDRNMVSGLYLLDPRRVRPLVTPAGDVYYSLAGDDLSKVPTGMVVPATEMIHDRINCLWHPLVGISPLYACAISATHGLRIQANQQAFFENMSRPSGMLTAPGTIEQPTADRLKAEFEGKFSGANLGRLFVGGDGLKYEPMTIPAEAAQLIDQLKWTVEDVARAFGMPLYKIGAAQVPAGLNVEALNQQYYSDCLQPHIEALELCLNEGLSVPSRARVELDLEGLIRMDQSAQIEMLTKGAGGAIMTPNEARAKRNLAPLTGGDTVYLQQQQFGIQALHERDQSKPFSKPTPAPSAPAPEPAKDGAETVDPAIIAVIQKIAYADAREALCGNGKTVQKVRSVEAVE